MSNVIWPSLPPDQLRKAEEETLRRELQWLLKSLQDTFASLKDGLEECNSLLAPVEPGSTLVLSSMRSEYVKGFITRVGTRIVKADIQLRFATLPPPPKQQSYQLRLSAQATAPSLVIPQLTNTRNLLAQALDVIDTSRWTGNSHDASFISGQLRLLLDLISEAKQSLRGNDEAMSKWYENPLDERTFDPPLPHNLALNLYISDNAIVAHFRTLHLVQHQTPTTFTAESLSSLPGLSGLSIRQRLGLAARLPDHDESDRVFNFRGQDVRVREKARVESQDPSLMALVAKLNALEHGVKIARRALAAVMDVDDSETD